MLERRGMFLTARTAFRKVVASGSGSQLSSNVEKTKYFLIPTPAKLSKGGCVIRDLARLERPVDGPPVLAFELSAAATDAWPKAELGRVLRQLGGKLRRSFPSMPPPNRHPDYDNEQLATRSPMSTPRPPFDFTRLHARQAQERTAAVAIAARLAARVREQVPPILRRYGAGRAWLFGSVTAGRCHGRSDVDLLVFGIAAADYWALRHDLEEALDRPVDLLTQDDDPVMVRKITERGVLIHEPLA